MLRKWLWVMVATLVVPGGWLLVGAYLLGAPPPEITLPFFQTRQETRVEVHPNSGDELTITLPADWQRIDTYAQTLFETLSADGRVVFQIDTAPLTALLADAALDPTSTAAAYLAWLAPSDGPTTTATTSATDGLHIDEVSWTDAGLFQRRGYVQPPDGAAFLYAMRYPPFLADETDVEGLPDLLVSVSVRYGPQSALVAAAELLPNRFVAADDRLQLPFPADWDVTYIAADDGRFELIPYQVDGGASVYIGPLLGDAFDGVDIGSAPTAGAALAAMRLDVLGNSLDAGVMLDHESAIIDFRFADRDYAEFTVAVSEGPWRETHSYGLLRLDAERAFLVTTTLPDNADLAAHATIQRLARGMLVGLRVPTPSQ